MVWPAMALKTLDDAAQVAAAAATASDDDDADADCDDAVLQWMKAAGK